MNIKIGNYEITSDKYNIVVSEVVTPKRKKSESGGQPYTIVRGYYPNLAEACSGLLKMNILDSEATSLQQLRDEISAVHAEISRTVTQN